MLRGATRQPPSLLKPKQDGTDAPVLYDELDALGQEPLEELRLAALVQPLDALLLERPAEHVQLRPVQGAPRRTLELEARLGEDERIRDGRRDGAREGAREEGLRRGRVLAVLGGDEGALERRKRVEGDCRVERLQGGRPRRLGRSSRQGPLANESRTTEARRRRTKMIVLWNPLQNPAMPCSS